MHSEKLIGRLTIRLADSHLAALDQMAEQERTTCPDLVRRAVSEFLNRQADGERLAAMEDRLVAAIRQASAETARRILENVEVAP